MSPQLVTQLSDESPRVLLVGEGNSLRRKIESFLMRQGLEVSFLSSSFNQEELKKSLIKDFYKIIILGSGETLKSNLTKFKQNKNTLVINLISTIEPDSLILTQNSVIIGQDVVPEEGINWPLFNFVTKNVLNNLLLDPQLNLFLQSEESFFNTIKPLILSPRKQRVLIKGKKHSSTIVINEILRLFNLFKPTILLQVKKEIKQSLKDKFSNYEEIEVTVEALPSLLEKSVRNIKIGNIINNDKKVEKNNSNFHTRILIKPEQSILKKEETTQSFDIARLDNLPEVTPLKKTTEISQVSSVQTGTKELDEKLDKIFKVKRVDQKVKRVKKIVKETKKIKKKTKKKKILFGLGVVFTVVAFSLLALTGVFFLSTSSLEKELTNLLLNFPLDVSSSQSDQDFKAFYSKVESKSSFLKKQISLYEQVLPPEVFIDSNNLVEISQKISEYDQLKNDFESNSENILVSFLGKAILEDALDSQKGSKIAQSYYETTSRLLSRLNDFKDTQNQEDRKEKIEEFISYLETQKKSLQTYQQLSPVLNLLLGKEGKKTYALVFQNNQELRPTGGFIQAVALLTVDKGMLVDSQVFSSYELDKNLGGSVVPPDDIVNLLGENKWYLRDSNWDPDFVNSGKQISWFLEQETNKKIDGVIGVNLYVLQNLLKEMGPLELEEYNEIITDKNILERSEFHSEIKLVESSDIEDYQANLLRYLLRDLVTKGQENPRGLFTAFSKSIAQKQMTIFMHNKDLAQSFSLLGWSGELINPKCPNQLSALPCQVDSLIINEANIGINKANYHTSREDSHIIEIKENSAKHIRNITLDNTSFSNAWPKGLYKSYFRFYIPISVNSLSLKIDGENIDKDSYEVIKNENHTLIGVLIETPIKTQKTVEISYVVPIEFSLPYSYAFFNQKQPGTDGILPQVIINHDPSLSPTLIAPQAEVQGNSIVFNNLGEDHAFVGVSFK